MQIKKEKNAPDPTEKKIRVSESEISKTSDANVDARKPERNDPSYEKKKMNEVFSDNEGSL